VAAKDARGRVKPSRQWGATTTAIHRRSRRSGMPSSALGRCGKSFAKGANQANMKARSRLGENHAATRPSGPVGSDEA
jgi:hypothetical protein